MNKKLLVSVFLCLFVFSLGMLAQEKRGKTKSFFMKEAKEGQFYEFLLRADGWGGIWEYEVPREDAGELHEKKSEIFTVLGFTSVEPHRVVCKIEIGGKKSRMPLTEIKPIKKDCSNNMVIEDYLKFLGI